MKRKLNKLSIIIPVYNEESTVEVVIKGINELKLGRLVKEIIVIDDGSTDNTNKLLKKLNRKTNFILIVNNSNYGKGFSVRRGIEKSTGEIILIQDADLEYQIKEYPSLLRPILNGNCQFVLGSRHLNTSQWKTRHFLDSKIYAKILNTGSIFYTSLVNLLLNTRLTDPGTMYKIFKRECLDGLILKSNKFDIDWEIVTKLVKKGYIPTEVPVSYKSRSPKEGKKIRLYPDGLLILFAIVRYRFFD